MSLVRGISDTARWVAYFRARETERPDALFRDPYAAILAGERGFQIANTLPDGNEHEWAWVTRTYLFDGFVRRLIEAGSDLILNLGSGLDTRPFRMDLPPSLQWVEIDFPEVLSYKEEVLANAPPACKIQRIALDLSDVHARRAVFAKLNARAKRIATLCEGLLIYFGDAEVASLAKDLAAGSHFTDWLTDLASPGQLEVMQRSTGKQLSEAGAAFKFGPAEGAMFFAPFGWRATEVQGLLKTAAQLKRAPDGLIPLHTETGVVPRHFPWTGVCLLTRPAAL